MIRFRSILLIAMVSTVFGSCAVTTPGLVTDNPVGDKTGKASYTVTLGIFRPMKADIGIKQAAENGNISKVATVDRKVKSGLFTTTYTTIVTGK